MLHESMCLSSLYKYSSEGIKEELIREECEDKGVYHDIRTNSTRQSSTSCMKEDIEDEECCRTTDLSCMYCRKKPIDNEVMECHDFTASLGKTFLQYVGAHAWSPTQRFQPFSIYGEDGSSPIEECYFRHHESLSEPDTRVRDASCFSLILSSPEIMSSPPSAMYTACGSPSHSPLASNLFPFLLRQRNGDISPVHETDTPSRLSQSDSQTFRERYKGSTPVQAVNCMTPVHKGITSEHTPSTRIETHLILQKTDYYETPPTQAGAHLSLKKVSTESRFTRTQTQSPPTEEFDDLNMFLSSNYFEEDSRPVTPHRHAWQSYSFKRNCSITYPLNLNIFKVI